MSLEAMLAPVRQRVWRQRLAMTLPLALAAGLLLGAGAGLAAGVAAGLAGLAACLWDAARQMARFDRRWLLRRLDAEAAELEDSSDLLLAAPDGLQPLAQLQRARLLARLEGLALDLRPAWRWRPVLLALAGLGLAAVLAAVLAVVLARPGAPLMGAEGPEAAGVAVPAALTRAAIAVTPPAYTGLPGRMVSGLAARAPVGSGLEWRLAFAPEAQEVVMLFEDGARLPLRLTGGEWQGGRTLARSQLYRLVVDGREGALQRLEAVPDLRPRVRVVQPAETVTVAARGMARWTLRFEAEDDFGVQPSATLRLVRAEGEGENVRFRESVRTLTGSGPATRRRFDVTLDLAGLGIGPGSELVAQLQVRDNRPAGGQAASSPSVILRVPGAREEALGLEAAVQRAMPAYFRSQRQIIIDIETLLAAQARLPRERFVARSSGIGDDQRILRMRYGRYLGEETAGQPRPPSLADLLTSDGARREGQSAGAAPKLVLPEGHDAFDGHDHGPSDRAPPQFGADVNVLAAFGHAHDDGEAATLFDPETRARLKRALDAMWRTERALRQGEAAAALPPAREALAFIKDVQQATRVFLARTSARQPPLDEGRRMGGKRDDIAPAAGALAAVPWADAVPAALHAALALRAPEAGELAALERWLASANPPDRLGLLAAVDEVRRAPDCAACRERLRAALWTALRPPPAEVLRRGDGGAAGARYLGGA